MIRSVVCFISFILYTTFFGIYGVILSLVKPELVTKYAVKPWAKMILFTGGVDLKAEGLDNIPETPCVIMYNHQSTFDIFAFQAVMPVDWRAIMKKEVANLPFIGWVSRLTGHYFVARDGSSSDSSEVKKIVAKIRSGPSVMVAPEGTRSDDGNLLPFQEGGFFIAMLAKVPVVPMVIIGGKNILPKNSKSVRSGKMLVKVLPPIPTDNLPSGKKGRQELMAIVRTQMEDTLEWGEKQIAA